MFKSLGTPPPLPRWAEVLLLPLINIAVAFMACAVVIWALGEKPGEVLWTLFQGPFLYPGNLGYTLYYTTNFIFTGLAVAVAFHAKLFNIGGEGQVTLGGLGVGVLVMALGPTLPAILMVPLVILVSAAFGALWALIPGYLQAYRGSHIVITTIMFNFIASAIMVSLLSGPMMQPGQMSPQTPPFPSNAVLHKTHVVLHWLGLEKVADSPMNLSFFVALLALIGTWMLIWRTRLGYEIRGIGNNPDAAHYAGTRVPRIVLLTMAISGALAGMMALNEVAGAQQRVILNFSGQYGFVGIAVALIGRNHPVGILLASLLFGALYQGGTEIDFNYQSITREMVTLIQGLIILFSGALYYMFDPWLARILALILPRKSDAEGAVS